MVKTFADLETGEVLNLYEGDKWKITTEEQRNAIQKSIKTKELNEDMKIWNNELGGFVFVLFKYCDKLLEQHNEIIPEDITKLFYLATYVDYEGYLIYEDTYMNRKIMMNVLGMTRNPFDKFYNKLIKLEIFIEDNKKILINKNYFIKGEIDKKIQKTYNYTRTYINTIKYLYENVSKKQHKRLGMYFKLIPYIHRQQNILCNNPDDNYNKLKLMNVRDLKNILGYHRSSIKSFIKELLSIRLSNGDSILGFFRTEYDEGESFIIINPRVYYGGNFDIEGGVSGILKWFKNKNK